MTDNNLVAVQSLMNDVSGLGFPVLFMSLIIEALLNIEKLILKYPKTIRQIQIRQVILRKTVFQNRRKLKAVGEIEGLNGSLLACILYQSYPDKFD